MLTGLEVRDLAMAAGFEIVAHESNEDLLEQEHYLEHCPPSGLLGDDGSISYFRMIATGDCTDGEGCIPLGDPIK